MRATNIKHTGGPLDYSLRGAEDLLPDPSMRDEVADLVAHFRFFRDVRATQDAKHTMENYFNRLAEKSRTLRDEIMIGKDQKMPDGATAFDPDLFPLLISLDTDLAKLMVKSRALQHKLAASDGNKGERTKDLETQLLSDLSATYERKGHRKVAAAGKALELLQQIEPHSFPDFKEPEVGTDAKEARKRVKAWRDRRGGNP